MLLIFNLLAFIAFGGDQFEDKRTKYGECVITGDPHTRMWNGAKHNFMGHPPSGDDDCKHDSFYYVARCDGVKESEMPISVIGKHVCVGRRPGCSRTRLDSLTLELSQNKNRMFYLYLSTDFDFLGYAEKTNGDVGKDFEETKASGALKKLRDDESVQLGPFQVSFMLQTPKKGGVKVKVTVKVDGKTFQAHMTQGLSSRGSRTAEIFQAKAYRGATCGLCGTFTPKQEPKRIETCDGQTVDIPSNIFPEILDINGWTYEYKYFNERCGEQKPYLPKVPEGVDVFCSPRIFAWTSKACTKYLDEQYGDTDCCTRKDSPCEWVAENCGADLCEIARDEDWLKNKQKAKLNAAVAEYFQNADDICEVEDDWLTANSAAQSVGMDLDIDQGYDDLEDFAEDWNLEKPKTSSPIVLELSGMDLVVIVLVALNVALVVGSVCMCLGGRKEKYAPVKQVYTSEDDEC